MDRRGLTLLELMVVLVLLAGAAAIAVPHLLHSFLPRYRLKGAATRLMNDMYHTKMLAVSSNCQYRIVIHVDTDTYCIEAGNSSIRPTLWTPAGACRVFTDPRNEAFFKNVHFDSVSSAPIVFSPTGGQTASTIALHDPSGRRVNVRSSLSGRIRMEAIE